MYNIDRKCSTDGYRGSRRRNYIFNEENESDIFNRPFINKHQHNKDIFIAQRKKLGGQEKNGKFLSSIIYNNTCDKIGNNMISVLQTNYYDKEYNNDPINLYENVPHEINNEKVVRNLTAIGYFLEFLLTMPLPRLSLTSACICFILAIFISPRPCVENVIFPVFRLSFGTLYPAYASYKAVRTKNVKEYVKWMMYWIVYAFFTCTETFTDIFLSWFPFYYEVKVVIVLWLLSPATKGSSTLYRKFVHPMLTRREQEIDEYLHQAKERGYSAVLQLGSKGVNYATNVIMQTAIKTFHYGLNATNHQQGMLPSSQSDNAIYARTNIYTQDEFDATDDNNWVPRSNSLNAIVSMNVEFSEDDENVFNAENDDEGIGATEDIGAARIREPPTRKTKIKVTNGPILKRSKLSKQTSKVPTAGIRPRRKLREATPDVDVDVE